MVDEQLGAALDAETESLLKDLQEQQLQVQAMLQQQREQSDELGGVKDRMAAEVRSAVSCWGCVLFVLLKSCLSQCNPNGLRC